MKKSSSRFLAISSALWLTGGMPLQVFAADGDLNFKIYSPDGNKDSAGAAAAAPAAVSDAKQDSNAMADQSSILDSATTDDAPLKAPLSTNSATTTSTTSSATTEDSSVKRAKSSPLSSETPVSDAAKSAPSSDDSAPAKPGKDTTADSAPLHDEKKDADATADSDKSGDKTMDSASTTSNTGSTTDTADGTTKTDTTTTTAKTGDGDGKVLQGYARVVPEGTNIPIIMDTAVDSDTSQEGDEFSARTSEDLSIDGQTLVPAGSIIKGRIATLNGPRHMMRGGSVALKFDTITTPDNRQIALVANLVAHGGVVHAKRGLKDIAIDAGEFTLPMAVGLGIGLIAGDKSSKVGVGGGAVIGAGIGAAVGLAILLAKKGKKVDVRPGDELKIQLAEDLRMPTL